MKKKLPHCRKNPKSNIKIVYRDKIDIPNVLIHNRSLSWLGTGTSIKCGGVKLVLWAQAPSVKNIICSKFFFAECYVFLLSIVSVLTFPL